MAQRLQRLRDRSGMMAKVVNHLYPPRFAAELQPPRNPGKTLERAVDFRLWHIVKPCCHRCHRCIVDIEFAKERNFESVFPERELGAFSRVCDVTNSLR